MPAGTVEEQQLSGANDVDVARVCREESRVLVSFDRGFANIRAYPPAQSLGMIVFRLKRQDKEHVLAVGRRLVSALQERAMANELWIVHDNRVRIRALGRSDAR